MHRVIRDHLEQVLTDSQAANATQAGTQDYHLHLQHCEECRGEVAAMRKQSMALRTLRVETDARPGFYARVMERIEAQRPLSIWNVFSESPFGKRIAFASMALAVLLGVYLVTSEQSVEPLNLVLPAGLSEGLPGGMPVQMISATLPGEDQPAVVLGTNHAPDRDAVLVNLVTYREQ